MIFHETTWGQDGDQVGTKLSAETLGAIWFGDISAPKPYAQLNLCHDILMVCASFTHGFRMVRSRFVPSHLSKPSASNFISIFEERINILVNSL